MNTDNVEARELLKEIAFLLKKNFKKGHKGTPTIILIPPFPFIGSCSEIVFKNTFHIGAQNCSSEEQGAYTGEVSAKMIRSARAEYVLVGHSERRAYFNETSDLLRKKVIVALKNDLIPIFCCGEMLSDRKSEKHFDVVKKQLDEGLFFLTQAEINKVIIAYEPVWAIGTGVNASPEEAQEMHKFIRSLVARKYGETNAENISIIYGGSCNASNIGKLCINPDVDGGLVGGASLNAEEFVKIILSI